MQKIELLCPARDAATAVAAINHGADAIYIGASSHGARASAANTVDDLARLVEYAHRFRVRVYVTLNTIIYDDELAQVERLVRRLYGIGVDALIVQDMALLKLDIPPIDLHASTQCDIRTPEKAVFLAQNGFSQLVLPREFSVAQTAAVRNALDNTPGLGDVALETFVHGALCVSYSGDCHAGQYLMERSANRGECPQICRLPYTLKDAGGNILVSNRHLLSLRDLNRTLLLEDYIHAGVTSFKIEGRLKDPNYVKETTAHYRAVIDGIIAAHPGEYSRASYGESKPGFIPDVNRCFNRGFTDFFSSDNAARIASTLTPKWTGVKVGTVIEAKENRLKVNNSSGEEIHNGDGFTCFNHAGVLCGFRINRAGALLETREKLPAIPKGTTLYRNHDVKRENIVASSNPERTIAVDAKLGMTAAGTLWLRLADERGVCATAVSSKQYTDRANTPQNTVRSNAISKTGGTGYTVTNIDISVPDNIFVPLKDLTELRRTAFGILDATASATYPYRYRRPAVASVAPGQLTYHANVANRMARNFYAERGAEDIEPAMEVSQPAGERRVMTTRYCIRREAGECLRQKVAKRKWPLGDLILASPNLNGTMRVHFNCDACQMEIFASH